MDTSFDPTAMTKDNGAGGRLGSPPRARTKGAGGDHRRRPHRLD